MGNRIFRRPVIDLPDSQVEAIAEGRDSLSKVMEELRRSADGGQDRGGVWMRKITLMNP